MSPTFAVILNFASRLINLGAQKIDGSLLEIYGMASTKFLLYNSLRKVQFFKETFLLANTSMKVVLEMFFFFLVVQIFNLIQGSLSKGSTLLQKSCLLPKK